VPEEAGRGWVSVKTMKLNMFTLIAMGTRDPSQPTKL